MGNLIEDLLKNTTITVEVGAAEVTLKFREKPTYQEVMKAVDKILNETEIR